MRESIKKLVDSNPFQFFIMAVIVLNAITLGIQTGHFGDDVFNILVIFDNVCLAIYIAEAVLKIIAYGGRYFRDGWNIFDFIIIVLCCIPSSILPISPQVARIIRIFRTFKAFRLVSAFRHMRIIVDAIIKSLPGVFWTAILMLIIFYIYAVIGTVAFADVFPDHFGNLGSTMYTLFQVMTLESWSEGVSRPVMEFYPWASAYFVSFVIISAFVMINVVVGIVVGTIDESQKELDAELEAEERKKQGIEVTPEDELAEIKSHLESMEKLLHEQNERIKELTASQQK